MSADINPFVELRRQLAGAPLLVGTVTAGSGSAWSVQLPDGKVITARGSASVGQVVFVRGTLIEGQAPSLPLVIVEI